MIAYLDKEIKFGDLLTILEKDKNIVLFVGITDSLSIKAKEIVYSFFKDRHEKVFYLHYDRNKSLMIDLNIRKIPVVVIFKNMDVHKMIYMPTMQEELEKYYEANTSG